MLNFRLTLFKNYAITHLVQAGVDLPAVKRISGHKTLIMVERYTHQNDEYIKVAMDKLENRHKKIGQIFDGITQELHKEN